MGSSPDAVDPQALRRLRAELPAILDEGRRAGHDVDRDPYLKLDPENLLHRYLIASEGDPSEAARRLRDTIAWRREWRVLEYYQGGSMRKLFSEASNPGAEMYFADSGHVDREGKPYLVGRVHYANASNLHPWRHLRAGVYVMERMAYDCLSRGCGSASYVLDIGEVPAAGTVSGTGGGKHKGGNESENPYYKRGAGKEAPAELLKLFGELGSGMAVLRAAIKIGSSHYPELLSRVVCLNSNWLFVAAFRVFSLWMHRRSRHKFTFVGGRFGHYRWDKLQAWYAPEELPEEFGGCGWRLDGDGFIAAAIERSDKEAKDGALAAFGECKLGFCGLDAAERALAEADARRRQASLASKAKEEDESTQHSSAASTAAAAAQDVAPGCWPCLACFGRQEDGAPQQAAQRFAVPRWVGHAADGPGGASSSSACATPSAAAARSCRDLRGQARLQQAWPTLAVVAVAMLWCLLLGRLEQLLPGAAKALT